MKKIIGFIFGPNGSGKGTLARHIAESYGYCHINTGRCLREWAEKNNRKDIIKLIDNGDFVEDLLVEVALRERFEKLMSYKGVIIEGVPRKLSQVNMIQRICKDFNFVPEFLMILNVPLDILIDRVKDRVVAPDGHVYHMKLNPPPKHFKLSELHTRPDDCVEIVKKRYESYISMTLECISDGFFLNSKVLSIDSTKPINEVFTIADNFLEDNGYV
jgi:adenylate kinase